MRPVAQAARGEPLRHRGAAFWDRRLTRYYDGAAALPQQNMTVVTLTTDFGTSDGYVGAMKGVVLSLAPQANVVDISHDIPRHDVAAGAFALRQAAPLFPAGTVHVAVVDPGVGGPRKDLLLQADGSFFVGPDNGVLTLATAGARSLVVRSIETPSFRRPRVSPTFHGRDVFAQAAGRLAAGMDASLAGPLLSEMIPLEDLPLEASAEEAVVLHVDSFGNVITSWPAGTLPGGRFQLEVSGPSPFELASARTYGDVATGELMAYVGSAGLVELAVREGSAAERLGLARGDRLRLRRAS